MILRKQKTCQYRIKGHAARFTPWASPAAAAMFGLYRARAKKQNDERTDHQDPKLKRAAGEPVVNPSLFEDERFFDLHHQQVRSAWSELAAARTRPAQGSASRKGWHTKARMVS